MARRCRRESQPGTAGAGQPGALALIRRLIRRAGPAAEPRAAAAAHSAPALSNAGAVSTPGVVAGADARLATDAWA
jgi:hypothetical protein